MRHGRTTREQDEAHHVSPSHCLQRLHSSVPTPAETQDKHDPGHWLDRAICDVRHDYDRAWSSHPRYLEALEMHHWSFCIFLTGSYDLHGIMRTTLQSWCYN